MRVVVASDHGGFCQKELICDYLKGMGHEVEDLGPDNAASVDYPDYAAKVAQRVSEGTADRGVLICGTGIGMALTANKFKGIRAMAVQSEEFAVLCREHNNCNILCLSGRFTAPMDNCKYVDIFMNTEFAGGRHAQRVAKIMSYDKE